ncbi:MAG: hypothetical protein R3255_07850 [Candidatus Lokiarchaeia archaeon]|nr:hypothetical protein [Candidatus Lokiarchaeia archaeon]
MKKIIIIQLSLLILISGSLSFMVIQTDIYDRIQSSIVEVLCLSCLKLEPKTETDFVFMTANGQPHPNFVLENLTKGVIFLHYSEDACHGCDIMYPIIKDLFNIEFGKEDMVYNITTFENNTIPYYYINLDHTNDLMRNSFNIYDKDNVKGLPMFTIVTLGYDRGIIKPYYTTLYGTLNLDNDEDRFDYLTELLIESIDIYSENSEGY